jgi:hypothetical protein
MPRSLAFFIATPALLVLWDIGSLFHLRPCPGDPPLKGTNVKDTNVKDTNVKDTNVKDTNVKDTNVKDTNVKDTS